MPCLAGAKLILPIEAGSVWPLAVESQCRINVVLVMFT